jgi:hypothetical protein
VLIAKDLVFVKVKRSSPIVWPSLRYYPSSLAATGELKNTPGFPTEEKGEKGEKEAVVYVEFFNENSVNEYSFVTESLIFPLKEDVFPPLKLQSKKFLLAIEATKREHGIIETIREDIRKAVIDCCFKLLKGEEWLSLRVRTDTHAILRKEIQTKAGYKILNSSPLDPSGAVAGDDVEVIETVNCFGTITRYCPALDEFLIVFDNYAVLQPKWILIEKGKVEILPEKRDLSPLPSSSSSSSSIAITVTQLEAAINVACSKPNDNLKEVTLSAKKEGVDEDRGDAFPVIEHEDGAASSSLFKRDKVHPTSSEIMKAEKEEDDDNVGMDVASKGVSAVVPLPSHHSQISHGNNCMLCYHVPTQYDLVLKCVDCKAVCHQYCSPLKTGGLQPLNEAKGKALNRWKCWNCYCKELHSLILSFLLLILCFFLSFVPCLIYLLSSLVLSCLILSSLVFLFSLS